MDIFDNPEEVLKVKTEVDDLDQETSESLVEFIDTERKTLEIAYGYKIVKSQTIDNQIDLLRCLGMKQAVAGAGRTEKQYGFLVQTMMAARRFHLTDDFAVCPTACGTSHKSIGFTKTFISIFLQHLSTFAPDNADHPTVEAIQSTFQHYEGNSIELLFNIREKAIVNKDSRIQVTNRGYDRKLSKEIIDAYDNEIERFVCANRFTTDGIPCNAYYHDWCTPERKDQQLHLPDISSLHGHADIGGLIGVDFGQTYTAAAFCLSVEETSEERTYRSTS